MVTWSRQGLIATVNYHSIGRLLYTAQHETVQDKSSSRYNESFHERFLIIDDKYVYLIGASLKDLGRKCFAFMKLDSGEIPRIEKTAFAAPCDDGDMPF